jgi:hypothetical protein
MAAKKKAPPRGRKVEGPLRLEAFEISEPSVFRKDVRLEVAPRHTVLVGRNGAGKSAVLEGLARASRLALGLHPKGEPFIPRFLCELNAPSGPLGYEFNQRISPGASGERTDGVEYEWDERCWHPKRRKKDDIWSVASSTARAPDGSTVKLAGGVGLLSAKVSSSFSFAKDANSVRSFLHNIDHVPAGVPRERREEVILTRSNKDMPWLAGEGDRAGAICATLLRWWSEDSELFGEFAAIGQRMGLFKLAKPEIVMTHDRRKEYGSMLVDGTDVGLIADGTLRVIEILCALLRPSTSLLLIEEPETSIHPGLLQKLLAEIEAYSLKLQVVLTTHSPQVVAWASPSEVRFVQREHERTTISSLSPRQIDQVTKYLTDDGTLGDFVFGGALDD